MCIAHDPGVRFRDIATTLDITERSAYSIVVDLGADSFVGAVRAAPASRVLGPFDLEAARPFPDPTLYAGRVVGELTGGWSLMGFRDVDGGRMRHFDDALGGHPRSGIGRGTRTSFRRDRSIADRGAVGLLGDAHVARVWPRRRDHASWSLDAVRSPRS